MSYIDNQIKVSFQTGQEDTSYGQPIVPIEVVGEQDTMSMQQVFQQPLLGGQRANAGIGQPVRYPSQSCLDEAFLIQQQAQAEIFRKEESARIDCQKAERQMKARENHMIERQARVVKVELSPEGVPVVSYQRVELPDFKCHIMDCRLEPYIFYPDNTDELHSDKILMLVCTDQKGGKKRIYFRLAGLTEKTFRRKLMRNGIAFQAPNRKGKANDLAELLIQMLVKNAKKVRIPTRLGWSIQDSKVTYVKEGQMLWKEAVSYAEDESDI